MLTLFANGDEARLAQHLEVLRHRGLARAERGDDLGDADLATRLRYRALAFEEHCEDVPTSRVRNHIEDVSHAPRLVIPRGEYHDSRVGSSGRGHRCAHSSSAVWVGSTDGHGSVVRAMRSTPSSRARRRASRSSSSPSLIVLFTVLFSLPIASADRQVTPLHDAAVHRRLRDLRHGSRDRRHGDPLVAVRQRARVHRREHRRRRRADARVDPRPRDLASARTAREAHRRERHEPVAHPRRPGRRTAGGAPRRGRRAARHGRDQRPGRSS